MTSRERILGAVNHQPVDRVPIDLGGTRQTGISAFAYSKLKKHLDPEWAGRVRIFDLFQILAEIDPEVAQRFRSDCVPLNRRKVAFGIENSDWKPGELHDGTRVEFPGGFNPETTANGDWVLTRGNDIIARMPAHGYYFDRFEKYPGALHPDLDSWEPPALPSADLEHYRYESRRLFNETDQAVVIALGPPYELFFGIGQGGFDEWMITLATEPDYVRRLYRILTDRWIENLEALHGAVGEHVQILQVCDDFGTQDAPFLSPGMFSELVVPAYKRGFDWIHQKTDWKVLFHSDGAIGPLLPDMIDMGVDILNPVQTTAKGMDAAWIQHTFGGRLAFWGGSCDCQNTLTFGSTSNVRNEVLVNLRTFQPLNGGFVFASVHNIQANVPPENIVALFDAVTEYEERQQSPL